VNTEQVKPGQHLAYNALAYNMVHNRLTALK